MDYMSNFVLIDEIAFHINLEPCYVDYYINFVKSTLYALDNHEEFKEHHTVIDNALIHSSGDTVVFLHLY
ncbi:hypothetical protein BCV72DRAFT_283581 [Rhizopus microsporus var. microsporus]|uniref:Uncharacterized protein n=1 Tax=Rhizopus microsporus var. microsporus TaxID=86635 RepID=A0A1X0RJF4_RHIZD|nr:hypothetical protein BCV72DRAFT_283581 [Rhizopus microsporus var. microsporus]